jgi:peptide-methionine (R)-S-oxide reductase
MTTRNPALGAIGTIAASLGLKRSPAQDPAGGAEGPAFADSRGNAAWRCDLSPEQYHVLREHGTERPGTSALNHEKRRGTFLCAACRQPLFSSETKYESGSGWPSFYKPIEGAVGTSHDDSLFMPRTEVHCANCGGHLGHVFEDGPPPTGLRYCMNGVAMIFEPAENP